MLPDLGITVTEAAKQLGVTRVTFSKIINGKSGISPDMALRLAQWLGASPDSWLNCRLLMISGKRSNGHIRLLLLPEYNMYEGEQLNNSCLTQLQLPHGYKAFNFKSITLPCHDVRSASNIDCLKYKLKAKKS